MDINQAIGKRIRTIRIQQGLKQELIADRLNVSPSAYSKMEQGKTNLSVKRIERIAEILEVPLAILVGSNQDAPQPKDYQEEMDKLKAENSLLRERCPLFSR